jgi:hypothetical protein
MVPFSFEQSLQSAGGHSQVGGKTSWQKDREEICGLQQHSHAWVVYNDMYSAARCEDFNEDCVSSHLYVYMQELRRLDLGGSLENLYAPDQDSAGR